MASKTSQSRQPSRRILCAASVRQTQEVFDAYWHSLNSLRPPKGYDLSYAFVNDDPALLWPANCAILPAPIRPLDAEYSVDAITHRWNVSTFEHLARCKQLLLDYAVANQFDYIFLVDSDLLLDPGTLQSLYAVGEDVVNANFWTQWTPQDQPMPQCWLQHPYGLDGLGMQAGDFLDQLDRHQLVRVIGGGACTLINTDVLKNGLRYHPRLQLPQGGMWQGEDRSFAVRCQQLHINQYCDAWPLIYHAYHPSMRTPQALAAAWAGMNAPQQTFAKIGDWINVKLTPMEDAQLQEIIDPRAACLRIRLGTTLLAPELEDLLLTLQIGDKRICDFTTRSGNPAYPPGQKRALMVELIDARPH